LCQLYSDVESSESIDGHPALTRQELLSNTEPYGKHLLPSPLAGAVVFAFGIPRGSVPSIPTVFLVQCGEIPYYVLEIL
jgi:hypothetical protein